MIFYYFHIIMRILTINTYLFIFIFLTFIVNQLDSQPTSPIPYDLANGTYRLLSWDSTATINPDGTYPPNMIFHQTVKQDPQLNDEMETDWKCPYNLDSRSRIEGLGDDGIGFINTGKTQDDSVCFNPGYVGEAVLALRTINYKNINISWIAGLVGLSGISNRQYCIRFQYRLGNSGNFYDLSDSVCKPVEYNYSGYLNNYPHPPHEQSFSVILPQEAEDRILVQVRWKYYYIPSDSASGTRPKLKIDDIDVKADIINSVQMNEPNGFKICTLSPNPACSKIELRFLATFENYFDIEIIDVFGCVITKLINYKSMEGNNIVGLDLSLFNLNSGIYFLKLISNGTSEYMKFIVIN
ncbi:MAG: T9SS type A sorting domain-containing protein [Bacteroidetes bacterium]|nr:MAG: T9SS type A sorting domain-containing protein [Bacteroidota bacterium]